MTARTEDGLDLIMNGKKLLGLFRRFEPPHNLFSPSGGAMWPFGSIVEALVAAVLYFRCEVFQGGPIASEFVRDNNSRLVKRFEELAKKPSCGLFVALRLDQDV
jgi:hypothetical protein